jgi:hypothetical protein
VHFAPMANHRRDTYPEVSAGEAGKVGGDCGER